MKPNDKPKKTEEAFEDPRLFAIIGEESFPKTGLKTAFVDYSDMDPEATPPDKPSETIASTRTTVSTKAVIPAGMIVSTDTVAVPTAADTVIVQKRVSSRCLCYFVTRSICTCNKMRPTCNCVGHVSSGTYRTTGCSCAPVH